MFSDVVLGVKGLRTTVLIYVLLYTLMFRKYLSYFGKLLRRFYNNNTVRTGNLCYLQSN